MDPRPSPSLPVSDVEAFESAILPGDLVTAPDYLARVYATVERNFNEVIVGVFPVITDWYRDAPELTCALRE